MASTGQSEESTVNLPALGPEGETCAQCGSVLAPDQRYCVNCGTRRGESRVDYKKQLNSNGHQPAAAGGPPVAAAPPSQWNPIVAVGAIGILGIMLLLGVLIGKDDNNGQVVAASTAPATTTTAVATPPPTDTTAAATNAKAAAGAAGQGNVEAGGSGSTEGIATADTAALEEAAKNGQGGQAGKALPNQVATGGNQEAIDPEGIKNAGGGSGSTCIGC